MNYNWPAWFTVTDGREAETWCLDILYMYFATKSLIKTVLRDCIAIVLYVAINWNNSYIIRMLYNLATKISIHEH